MKMNNEINISTQLRVANEKNIIEKGNFENLSLLILKVTNKCNLHCIYCHENKLNIPDMSMDIFIKAINSLIPKSRHKKINILFHGGEPSLLDIGWYQNAIDSIHEVERKFGKKIKLSMQSNLVKLTNEQIDFYRKNEINISASLDGIPRINNLSRGSGDKIVRNIKKAVEAKILRSILTVINENNYDQMYTFAKWIWTELGIRALKANVVYPVGNYKGHNPISADKIFLAWKQMIEYMIETNGVNLYESNLQQKIFRFFNEDSLTFQGNTICNKINCGAGTQTVAITSNGKILPCGRFLSYDKDWIIGEVNLDNLELHQYKSVMEKFDEITYRKSLKCNSCDAKSICDYRCNAFLDRINYNFDSYCEAERQLYNYFCENQSLIKGLYSQFNLQSLFPLISKTNNWDDYSDGCRSDYSDSWYRD